MIIKMTEVKYYHPKIKKYCCKDMKRMIKHSWELRDDGVWMEDSNTGYEPINYCPFCGEKIVIN